MGHFEEFFEGALTFLTPKLPFLRSGKLRGQKGLRLLEKSLKMPEYMFCLRKKNNLQHFQNQ
jgi:hypothetical protein